MAAEDAELVAAAEAAVEAEMGARRLPLAGAIRWVAEVAHAEGIEPPSVVRGALPRRTHGVAVAGTHAIVVASGAPTVTTLLHELAHLLCPESGHGADFRRCLEGLYRRHLSIQHAAAFARGFSG